MISNIVPEVDPYTDFFNVSKFYEDGPYQSSISCTLPNKWRKTNGELIREVSFKDSHFDLFKSRMSPTKIDHAIGDHTVYDASRGFYHVYKYLMGESGNGTGFHYIQLLRIKTSSLVYEEQHSIRIKILKMIMDGNVPYSQDIEKLRLMEALK